MAETAYCIEHLHVRLTCQKRSTCVILMGSRPHIHTGTTESVPYIHPSYPTVFYYPKLARRRDPQQATNLDRKEILDCMLDTLGQ